MPTSRPDPPTYWERTALPLTASVSHKLTRRLSRRGRTRSIIKRHEQLRRR